jgi:hypothetical protein
VASPIEVELRTLSTVGRSVSKRIVGARFNSSSKCAVISNLTVTFAIINMQLIS